MSDRPPLLDRISNRLVRHFPAQQIRIPDQSPVISFTFDDVPKSAQTEGARILADHDVQGTFYISGSLTGKNHGDEPYISLEGQRRLLADGHEMACHTFSHSNVRTLSNPVLQEDIERNNKHFMECEPKLRVHNFAYPYTNASLAARRELLKRYRTCRGGLSGINRGLVDRGYLSAVEIRPDTPVEQLIGWINDLQKSAGWLIFFTHDVGNEPSQYGCYSSVLEKLVSHALDLNFDVLPVNDSLVKMGLIDEIDNAMRAA